MPDILPSLKLAWERSSETNTGLLAAGIAYYAFLSFMPLLAAMVLGYGLFVDPGELAGHIAAISATLPASVSELVTAQLESVTAARKGTTGLGLILALGLAVFGARVGAGAVINAVNIAFRTKDRRGLVRANLLALAITLGALIAMAMVGGITTVVAAVLGGRGGAFLAYAVVAAAGFCGAYFAYKIIPFHIRPSRKAAMHGATLFALGWMLASAAFGFYAANLASYNATYGSLGGIVIFLTWLFLSAFLLLLGAHLTAVKMRTGDR